MCTHHRLDRNSHTHTHTQVNVRLSLCEVQGEYLCQGVTQRRDFPGSLPNPGGASHAHTQLSHYVLLLLLLFHCSSDSSWLGELFIFSPDQTGGGGGRTPVKGHITFHKPDVGLCVCYTWFPTNPFPGTRWTRGGGGLVSPCPRSAECKLPSTPRLGNNGRADRGAGLRLGPTSLRLLRRKSTGTRFPAKNTCLRLYLARLDHNEWALSDPAARC